MILSKRFMSVMNILRNDNNVTQRGQLLVEVIHEDKSVIWLTEQSPFADRSVKSSNKFIFSWDQIISFSSTYSCYL